MSMRKRLLSLLSVFACLCVLFSSLLCATVSADDVYNINGDVYLHEAYVRYQSSSTTFDWMKKTDLLWTTIPGNTAFQARFGKDLVNSPYLGFRLIFEPYANETSVKVPAGYYISLSIGGNDVSYIGSNQGLNDYYFNAWVTDKLGEVYVSRTTPSYYNEGSQWFANLLFHVGSGDKDAEITEIVIESNFPSSSYGANYYDIHITMTATHIPTADQRNHEETIDAIGDAADEITANQDKNTNSLLAKLQGVLDSILQLPQKIWEKISEGLKALFVPDSEYISGFRDRFDTLLSDRFGGVYQAAGIIKDLLVDVIVVDKADDTITLPVTKIPLPGNQDFSFGGYKVDIIPAGLENLLWYVKLAVGIVATILFINILRILYDEVMGVEDQR